MYTNPLTHSLTLSLLRCCAVSRLTDQGLTNHVLRLSVCQSTPCWSRAVSDSLIIRSSSRQTRLTFARETFVECDKRSSRDFSPTVAWRFTSAKQSAVRARLSVIAGRQQKASCSCQPWLSAFLPCYTCWWQLCKAFNCTILYGHLCR